MEGQTLGLEGVAVDPRVVFPLAVAETLAAVEEVDPVEAEDAFPAVAVLVGLGLVLRLSPGLASGLVGSGSRSGFGPG